MFAALVVMAVQGPLTPPELRSFFSTCGERGQGHWGRSLCAPIVVVDPASGEYRTSRTAPGAALPPGRANTAFEWGGEPWIMVLESLPDDRARLASLLFHEAWHVHQETLGFPANMAVAAHLDEPPARYLMRLEWKALEAALRSLGAERRRHVAQALAFQDLRLAGDETKAQAERDQMCHEGLAEYTGAALSGDPLRLALEGLESGPGREALARSFAYVSGPAWGLLLDDLQPGWRTRLASCRDLPELVPVDRARIARPDDYGGSQILAEETLAGLERSQRLEAAMEATSEGRALRLPLARMGMDFNPNQVTTAADGSNLYFRITLRDLWGEIRTDGTPLRIAPDFSAAFVPWPLPDPDALTLTPGWEVKSRASGGFELDVEE